MALFLDETLLEHNMDTSNFAHVIFQNVWKSYLPHAALECHYTLTQFIRPHPKDWVGIFKVRPSSRWSKHWIKCLNAGVLKNFVKWNYSVDISLKGEGTWEIPSVAIVMFSLESRLAEFFLTLTVNLNVPHGSSLDYTWGNNLVIPQYDNDNMMEMKHEVKKILGR